MRALTHNIYKTLIYVEETESFWTITVSIQMTSFFKKSTEIETWAHHLYVTSWTLLLQFMFNSRISRKTGPGWRQWQPMWRLLFIMSMPYKNISKASALSPVCPWNNEWSWSVVMAILDMAQASSFLKNSCRMPDGHVSQAAPLIGQTHDFNTF